MVLVPFVGLYYNLFRSFLQYINPSRQAPLRKGPSYLLQVAPCNISARLSGGRSCRTRASFPDPPPAQGGILRDPRHPPKRRDSRLSRLPLHPSRRLRQSIRPACLRQAPLLKLLACLR